MNMSFDPAVVGVVINALVALFTLVATIAAWRAANAARQSVEAARRANKATPVEVLRGKQPEISDANTALAKFVEEHGESWLETFNANKAGERNALASHRKAVKNAFILARLYCRVGVLDQSDIVEILSRTTAEMFLDVVEPMERVINPDYAKENFRDIAPLYGLPRYCGVVHLVKRNVQTRYLPEWGKHPS